MCKVVIILTGYGGKTGRGEATLLRPEANLIHLHGHGLSFVKSLPVTEARALAGEKRLAPSGTFIIVPGAKLAKEDMILTDFNLALLRLCARYFDLLVVAVTRWGRSGVTA